MRSVVIKLFIFASKNVNYQVVIVFNTRFGTKNSFAINMINLTTMTKEFSSTDMHASLILLQSSVVTSFSPKWALFAKTYLSFLGQF